MVRLLIVTDAWHPQINGVVRSLTRMGEELTARGIAVIYLTPDAFWTMPLPTYPEIRLSLAQPGAVSALIDRHAPHHIHIATEGPLGLMARYHCVARRLAFTTSYHTRFPEYVAARLPVPAEWSYGYLRWFHGAAARTLVPTPSAMTDLAGRGFSQLSIWSRGVDHGRFSPGRKTLFGALPGPHLVNVGRVAVEKNVEAFLGLDVPGTKVVVGDGPQRAELEERYPEAHFLGTQVGDDLVAIYRSADALVFPSRTDTFGNVMIEAMACGTPIAAYPVMGPIDVVGDSGAGVLDDDLGVAIAGALRLSRPAVRRHVEGFTWSASADQFVRQLVEARPQTVVAA